MKQHTFDLFWSPTGQKIATVEATTARQAIRKTPKPYSKFKGEIYTVCLNPSSFIAHVTAGSGLLLGGVRETFSSRFELESDAHKYLKMCVETNQAAGRDVTTWEVIGTALPFEIARQEGK